MVVIHKGGWYDPEITIEDVAEKEVRAKSVDPIQEQACPEALKEREIGDVPRNNDVITSAAKHAPLKADPKGPQP